MLPEIFLLLTFSSLVISENCSVVHTEATKWSVNCSNLNFFKLPTFKNYPIVWMELQNNKLSNENFSDWNKLQKLNLAENRISHLSFSIFKGLKNLNYLNVSNNLIKTVDVDFIKDSDGLKILDLSNNEIGNDPNFYKALNLSLYMGLKQLYIKSVNLSNSLQQELETAYELEKLDMSYNNIIKLPQFPKSLKYLDISGNNITELKLHNFYLLSNLEVLIAENNLLLTTILEDAFHYTTNLKKLSLKGCKQLNYLPKSLLIHIPLNYLSIASCSFSTIQFSFKFYFTQLDFVDLRDNPWECGANIKWMKSLKPHIVENVRCDKPYNVSIERYFDPQIRHQIMKNLIGTLTLLIVLFFFLAIWFTYDMEMKRRRRHIMYENLGKARPDNPISISSVV